MKTKILIALFSLVMCFAFFGCAAKDAIKVNYDEQLLRLAQMEKQGAKYCAPREFASAEAYLDFCYEEWAERDYNEALHYLHAAGKEMDRAEDFLDDCLPKTVDASESPSP